ncbi:dnaJ homolog subfamily C member 30, mitochondrial-like [Nymphalis io]|uniref:dnaJ homolog subfamily C member 30, mitochondrial-like n=1 Tax=Inachis io TaxID=171585 RepID=UPI00216748E9|nr:dnaJ homolog subfamily C member 30, mitochondrial-like [Nymphalis io]
MLGQNKARIFSGVLRSISTTPSIAASHYDVLGVTPSSTQSDIKSAYYKLSKLYHPDTSKDEESAKKFRAITEAYKVLGNIKLKKMYDKGLLVGTENTSRMDFKPEPEPTDPTLKFYKSRQVRNVIPNTDGRTPIYDFDTWSRNHYGDLLKKKQYEQNFIKTQQQKQVNIENDISQEKIMYVMVSILVLFIGLITYGRSDYDTDNTEKQKKAEQESSSNV